VAVLLETAEEEGASQHRRPARGSVAGGLLLSSSGGCDFSPVDWAMCSAGAAVAVGRKASEGTRRGEYSPEKRGRTGAVVRQSRGAGDGTRRNEAGWAWFP
jgi:hypothetical protein